MDWDVLGESLWEFVIGLHERINVQGGNMAEVVAPEGLTPERIMALGKKVRRSLLATLTPEERLAGLAPEERLAGLAPEERLAGLNPEERLAGLNPEDRLAGLAPEERLAGLAPEERLAGLAPEERLAGLNAEELAGLLEEIEAYLHQQGKKTRPASE